MQSPQVAERGRHEAPDLESLAAAEGRVAHRAEVPGDRELQDVADDDEGKHSPGDRPEAEDYVTEER